MDCSNSGSGGCGVSSQIASEGKAYVDVLSVFRATNAQGACCRFFGGEHHLMVYVPTRGCLYESLGVCIVLFGTKGDGLSNMSV